MNYQVTIRVSFESMDDLEARTRAKDIIQDPKLYLDKADIKVHKIYKDKPLERISM